MYLFDAIIGVLISSTITAGMGSQSCPWIEEYCPPLWQRWGGTCYRLTADSDTWDNGQAACQAWGGATAAPRAPEENEFLRSLAQNAGLSWLWIACKLDGGWKCAGHEAGQIFFNWNPGEPSLSSGSGACAYLIISSGERNDVPCTERPRAVCVQKHRNLLHIPSKN